MKVRKILMACALGIVSTLAVASMKSLRADDGCDVLGPGDYCEYESSGGGFEDGSDFDSMRMCGDYDKERCGGETTVTKFLCLEWKAVTVNASAGVTVSPVPSGTVSGQVTVVCANSETTVRTYANRWDTEKKGMTYE